MTPEPKTPITYKAPKQLVVFNDQIIDEVSEARKRHYRDESRHPGFKFNGMSEPSNQFNPDDFLKESEAKLEIHKQSFTDKSRKTQNAIPSIDAFLSSVQLTAFAYLLFYLLLEIFRTP